MFRTQMHNLLVMKLVHLRRYHFLIFLFLFTRDSSYFLNQLQDILDFIFAFYVRFSVTESCQWQMLELVVRKQLLHLRASPFLHRGIWHDQLIQVPAFVFGSLYLTCYIFVGVVIMLNSTFHSCICKDKPMISKFNTVVLFVSFYCLRYSKFFLLLSHALFLISPYLTRIFLCGKNIRIELHSLPECSLTNRIPLLL